MRKKRLNRILSLLLALTLCSVSVIPSFAEENIFYNKEGFTIQKVSHPTRGQGEVDSILTGEDEDRGNSYSWSIVEYGDYIYIGTGYNPIYGIYYRNVVANLKARGVEEEKASEIANKAIDLMYNGAFYQSTDLNAVIMKVNKKTYEAEVVYRNQDPKIKEHGYRMAAEYNGKLYFVTYGFPRSSLLEIDPENNDQVTSVYDEYLKNPAVANGIRGLVALDDKLIVSVTGMIGDKPGIKMLASENPSSKEWTEIANQDTFDDLPACYIRDGINGGGLWDIVEFNGSIYATMVTAKTDENGVTNKRGFAMYRGDEVGDTYKWTQIIGDKSKGAKYSFGLGVDEASAGNIFVYDNHLYIGNYNDPMLDLAEIPDKGNFKPLYNDLYNSINLYRMDTNENIELIGGRPNEEFPVVKGNLGPGLGSPFNQYVWRYGEHNGKLYVGTYDTSTLTNGFTQLTNGDLLKMTPEEFEQKMKYVQEMIGALISVQKTETEVAVEEQNVQKDSEAPKEDVSEDTNSEAKEDGEAQAENASEDVNTEAQLTNENDAEVQDTEANDAEKTKEEELLGDLSEKQVDKIKDIKESDLDKIVDDSDKVMDKIDGKSNKSTYSLRSDERTIVDDFNSLVARYDKISKYLPSRVRQKIEKVIKNEDVENFVYYLGINNYCIHAEKGFDLLVSSDGVNFDAITRNGFNDKFNHGIRVFESTKEGLFIGTANPFYGTQLWKLNEDGEIVEPEEPEDKEDTYSVTIKYQIKGETDIKVPEDTVVEGLKAGEAYDLTNRYTAVKESLIKAGCTVEEEPVCKGNIAKENVQLNAVFKAPAKQVKPSKPAKKSIIKKIVNKIKSIISCIKKWL